MKLRIIKNRCVFQQTVSKQLDNKHQRNEMRAKRELCITSYTRMLNPRFSEDLATTINKIHKSLRLAKAFLSITPNPEATKDNMIKKNKYQQSVDVKTL